MDKSKFYPTYGTVQCYLHRYHPHCMLFYGRAEYDSGKPIMTDSLREQGQKVCDKLNANEITVEQAQKILDKIWY